METRDGFLVYDPVMKTAALIVLLAFALSAQTAQRKPGSELDNLPKNIEVLTHFGERADISPDNQRVAFMTKSFGDAMMIDLETGSSAALRAMCPRPHSCASCTFRAATTS